MRFEPFRLERWLLNKAEIDLGGGGVKKLKLGQVLESIDPDHLLKYDDTSGSESLKQHVAEWYGVEPENVLITSGTSEANLLVNLAILRPMNYYVSENPNYEQTVRLAEALGVRVLMFNLLEDDNWKPDLDGLKNIKNKITMIFLDNPNNPTGAVLSQSELESFMQIAEDFDAYLHCDNALRGSEINGKPAPVPYPEYEKGIITGSISKLGATSPRIGWIIADKNLIERFWVVKDYTTLGHSGLGEFIAEKILRQREHLIERNLKISQRNLKILDHWIADRPDFYWRPPEAGFTGFSGYNLDYSSMDLCEKLLEKKSLLVSPGEFFGVDKHIRINLGCTEKELRDGLIRINDFLQQT
ncbi:aminotransferase class I/II-fold pyridoxal phosphate-dependent enzyme [Candidatus Bathyarchaeota archaeon]|nr:aminotransferase class I/II-fold pyridoxal phosphate-dependent enzyme [Candidatus Bathyarchaeota archaeon]